MTALAEFEKIEAVALWRSDASAQGRNVVVVLGDATLTIRDMQDRPLAHWSLPAVARANPGKMPALFHPVGDPEETLEFDTESDVMVEAIEKLRRAVERKRPKPGRLRLTSFATILAAVAALGVFWLPGAVLHQTLAVLPEVKVHEIGQAIAESAERFTGQPCHAPEATTALNRLTARVLPIDGAELRIVPNGVTAAIALPGDLFLAGRPLVEDYEEPEVLAGFLLAEKARVGRTEALTEVLRHAGVWHNIRLLTTGTLSPAVIESYATALLSADRPAPSDAQLLAAFGAVGISTEPYARALDITGETTLPLIEADPTRDTPQAPLLSDGAWVALQGICEG